MLDAQNRQIEYLRVSVTDRCNLRCRYCMPHDLPSVPHGNILRFEEILRVCSAAASLGIHRFRVTGGEPLVRRGVPGLLGEMRRLPGVGQLALTTNGALLKKNMPDLLPARLDAVNISLDTLDSQRYRRMTGFDALPDVLNGIEAALDAGIRVRLNCVVLSGVNEGDVMDLAALAVGRPIDVRFIELMPLGAGRDYRGVPGAELMRRLSEVYDFRPTQGDGGGPARYYAADGLMGRIGFIDALSGHFCGGCNRVRLSSEGFLKLCLYHDEGIDLRQMLRGGATDEQLRAAMERAIWGKPIGHQFGSPADAGLSGLSNIGG